MTDFSDWPHEVLAAKSVLMAGHPHGHWVLDVIKKYPQYFPEETTYMNLPQEVHDAFMLEAYGIKPNDPNDKIESRKWQIPEGATYKPLDEKGFADFFVDLIEQGKKKKLEEERVNRIWNKHYANYGLKKRV